VLAPLIVALIPLVIAPGLVFYFDVTPKIALLLLGVAATLPWFAPGALLARREGRWLALLLAVQAGSLALSTVFSSRAELSLWGTNWRRFGLITQLALLLFTATIAADLGGSRQRLQFYLRAVVAAAIPISMYGIAQYFGWDPWIPKKAYHIGEGVWTIVRPPGTLGYVSYFANYLVFVVFFGLALHKMEEGGWWQRAGALAAILGTFAIVLSGTRAAILALAVGAAFLWIWFGRPMRRGVVAIGASALIVLALFVASPAGQKVRSRFRWYVEDAQGGARLLLFRDSLMLAVRHPLLGVGPETFAGEFARVQSAALSRAYPAFYHESAHNILLDALTGQGVVGALALAGLIGLGFYTARRSENRSLAGILAAGLFAGVIAHQFSVFTVPTALYFFLNVAMLTALVKTDGSAARVSVFIATPISLALIVIAVRMVVADRGLEVVRAKVNAGETTGAAVEYSRVRTLGLTADIWYSGQLALAAMKSTDTVEALRRWQQALESGVRATKTADDPQNAWYNLSILFSQQNDFKQTERCLREAITSSPNWFKPHWMLAQLLLLEGRIAEARGEAELAADLNGGRDPEVGQTLDTIRAKNK